MEVRAMCIDDSRRPRKIPKDKWLTEGHIYTVIYASWIDPQKNFGFQVSEIDLSDTDSPYQYFMSERFAFNDEGLVKIKKLINACMESEEYVNEFLNEINSYKIS